jgi:hypothetical protein
LFALVQHSGPRNTTIEMSNQTMATFNDAAGKWRGF